MTGTCPCGVRVGEPPVGEVVAVDVHAVGAEPDVGGDLVPAGGGDREGPDPTGLGRRRRRQPGAEPQLDAQLVELTVQVSAHLGLEGGQELLGRVDDGHVLVRPDLLDLAGQLQADRPGAGDQHPLGVGQLLVRPAQLVQRLDGGVGVGLGRVGVAGARGEDQVVRLDAPTRGQGDAGGVDGDHPVAHHGAVRRAACRRRRRCCPPSRAGPAPAATPRRGRTRPGDRRGRHRPPRPAPWRPPSPHTLRR